MKQRVAVINVRLPTELIEWLDSLVKRDIFNSRSEAVREYSRQYIIKNRDVK